MQPLTVSSQQQKNTPATGKVIAGIAAITLCRTAINSARRFAYPFAPTLSRGLGVPLTDIASLIALSQSAGVACLFSGPLTDRLGYRFMMGMGLFIMIAGLLAAGFFPFYSIFCCAFFLAVLSKFIFDPAVQAYVGKYVPYARRGRAVGILETSWAASTLVGIPVIGLLIYYRGWRSPFFFLAVCGMIGLLAIRRLVPKDTPVRKGLQNAGEVHEAWRHIIRNRPALSALGVAFLISAANDMLFVVYGAWLEKDFGLSVAAIGLGTGIIGAAELTGEMLTAFFADRFGLKRSICAGLILSCACYSGLGIFQGSYMVALFGLFAVFMCFEFTIVTFLSLSTELAPAYRATMMSGILAAAGLGRAAGAWLGVPVWQIGGIEFLGYTAAAVNLAALPMLIIGLRDWRH